MTDGADTEPRGLLVPAWCTRDGYITKAVVARGRYAGMTPTQVAREVKMDTRSVRIMLQAGKEPEPLKVPKARKRRRGAVPQWKVWVRRYFPRCCWNMSREQIAELAGIGVQSIYAYASAGWPPTRSKEQIAELVRERRRIEARERAAAARQDRAAVRDDGQVPLHGSRETARPLPWGRPPGCAEIERERRERQRQENSDV